MKIVLTGATGFVGAEVLNQLIADPSVDQVTCVVRRDTGSKAAKVRTIILNDFTSYDSELAADLANHAGCIWTLGGKVSDLGPGEFEKITTSFTLSFAESVSKKLTLPFRFCYLSGMGADPTETVKIPWEKLTRHAKGRTEKRLEQTTKQQTLFQATAFRPAGILPKDLNKVAYFLLSPIAIRVETLCKAMIREAQAKTIPSYRVLTNSQIKALGK